MQCREWLGYWTWGTKPEREREAVAAVLGAAGFEVENLRSREPGQDPPDCEAFIDGVFCGIEVVELVHRPTLKRSIKARRERRSDIQPARPEAYFAFGRDDFIGTTQALILAKDRPDRMKGGPYERLMLVIVTDEFYLDRHTVERFLSGATFMKGCFAEVVLGLSYHPGVGGKGGSIPAFRL